VIVVAANPTQVHPTQINPIVLVAGGTGGHVFPAQALAGELRAKGYTLALLTDDRGAAWADALGDIATHAIRAGRVTGVTFSQRIKGVWDLALGALQSRRLLRGLAPSVVIGFGGYTSVPAMLAATYLRLPTVLHEQNALLGRANRLLAPRVSVIATSFTEVQKLEQKEQHKVVYTGNPVRGAVEALRDVPYQAPEPGGPIRLLVTGGSQGARVFSDVVPNAIARLSDHLRARIQLAQQCRPEDLERVKAVYDESGFNAELAPFFEDISERLGQAHLVICRSGASTVAELTAAGRPAMLVPYAHAADDHQAFNARAIAERGGAEIILEPDFKPEILAARLKLLLEQPATLSAMAAAAHGAGIARAASNLAAVATELIPVGTGDADGNGREAA
jgi:UDP-N-acetylglucosamine--N-acetylmuramyl-(pentapeptide) pyrophosphoryl-undecaprenol N-acetylglucosamine transferase